MKAHGQYAGRISFRCSPEFQASLQAAADRAQLSVADVLRLAAVDWMALNVVRDGILKERAND